MNGNVITERQLVNAYKPEESTLLDSFLADFTKDRKGKHRVRSIAYLTGDNPDLMHQVL